MVLTTDDYWGELSKYSLSYQFIRRFRNQLNWYNLFNYNSDLCSNTKFLLFFQKNWQIDSRCIHIIFKYNLFDELSISFFYNYIDWHTNLMNGHLTTDFLYEYKEYIFNNTIKHLHYYDFVELLNLDYRLYDLFYLDYIKYHKKNINLEDLMIKLNHPKFIKKWIEHKFDYEGEPFDLL